MFDLNSPDSFNPLEELARLLMPGNTSDPQRLGNPRLPHPIAAARCEAQAHRIAAESQIQIHPAHGPLYLLNQSITLPNGIEVQLCFDSWVHSMLVIVKDPAVGNIRMRFSDTVDGMIVMLYEKVQAPDKAWTGALIEVPDAHRILRQYHPDLLPIVMLLNHTDNAPYKMS